METRGEPHPRPETLAAFVAGTLNRKEVRTVVAHLLRGCDRCREELRPRVGSLWPEEPPRPEAYRFAIERANARTLSFDRDLAWARAKAAVGAASLLAGEPPAARPRTPLETWVWCDLMVRLTEIRGLPAAEAAELGRQAVAVAEHLTDPPLNDEDLADLRARAWAAFGNVCRLAGDVASAESAFTHAFAWLEEGSGDARLAARLAELAGSLFRVRRRYPEAYSVLDATRDLYLALGDRVSAARTLITKVATLILEGSAERAVAVAVEAFELLDGEREPGLIFMLAHNVLLALVDLDRHEDAAALLWRVRRMARAGVATTDQVRLLGLEARIEASAGRLDRAERLFREALEGFSAARLDYAATITAIELAGVLLAAGRPAEALPLLDRALALLGRMNVGREATTAVLRLQEAVARGEATAALIRATIVSLGRLARRGEGDLEDRPSPLGLPSPVL